VLTNAADVERNDKVNQTPKLRFITVFIRFIVKS